MEPSIAYLANGRLFLKLAGKEPREVESKFGNQVIARSQKNSQRDAWKSQSVWGSGGMGMPDMGQFQKMAVGPNVRFEHVCRGTVPGEIHYVLKMDQVVGVFRYVIDEDREVRVLHRDSFWLESLDRHPQEDLYAMSIQQETGTVKISTSEGQIRPINSVSGGFTKDQMPSWARDDSKRLLFQSAQIGKDENGYQIGVGPYAIELLDVDEGKVSTIREAEAYDFLAPKVDRDGWLYYIRRPWKMNQPTQLSTLEFIKDVVLFPYRVCRTIVYFFNFISMMFSGRPLANSMDFDVKPADQKQQYLSLWGQALDTRKAINKKTNKFVRPLVPADWELCRETLADAPVGDSAEHSQKRETLAANAMCFDIDDGGKVVYSDGTRVYYLDRGKSVELVSGSLIQSVTVIDA